MKNSTQRSINLPKTSIITLASSILVIIAIMVSTSFPGINYNDKRITEVLTLVTIMFSSIFIPRQQVTKNKTFILLCFVFLLGLASSFLSISPRHALIEQITFIGLFTTIILISPIWKSKHFFFLVASTLIFSMLITEVVFFTSYLAYCISGNNFSIHDFFPSFANVRFFNQYQIWTMPYISVILLQKNTTVKKYNYIIWPIAVAWWLIFFSTGSRGATLAELTAFIVTWYFFKNQIKDFILITVKLCFFGFISYQFLFNFLPYLIYNDTDTLLKSLELRNTTADRLFLWEKAYHFITQNPFLGIGPMHYALSVTNDSDSLNSITHPHNSVLQWAAEWGVISLLSVITLIYIAFKKWFIKYNPSSLSNIDKNRSYLVIATTISVISAMIYSLLSGVIVMPSSQLTAIMPISLMLYLYSPNTVQSSVKPCYLYKGFIIFIIILYFYLLIPDIINIFFNTHTTIEVHTHHPRFWLDGQFRPPTNQ